MNRTNWHVCPVSDGNAWRSIKEAWEAQREIKNVMIFLQSHDVSTAHAAKIYKTYGNDAIPIVTENPYQLADDIYGIGFVTADTIAQKLGMDKAAPQRVEAGIKYVLSQKADEGHVFQHCVPNLLRRAKLCLNKSWKRLNKVFTPSLKERKSSIPSFTALSKY